MYYLAKIKFETENDKNGKTQTTKEEYLVEADSVSHAETKMKDKFRDSMADTSVFEVKESKIMGIIK